MDRQVHVKNRNIEKIVIVRILFNSLFLVIYKCLWFKNRK